MDRQVVSLVPVVIAMAASVAGCGLRGGGHELDGLCKFASRPLTTDAEARELSAEIRAAMPQAFPNRSRNRAIAEAAGALMVLTAGGVGNRFGGDASLPSEFTPAGAQLKLKRACSDD